MSPDGRVDLLVVGGGIVGAGVARDAAQRGLTVVLVDQSDFASGTSSRSSRLLHGGIRYLGQGRIGLVREASREKKCLAETAPHLVEPLPFLFPSYRGGRWPRWQLGIGVKLYDILCGGGNVGPSTTLDAGAMQERLPGLNPKGLTGGVRYFDGQTHDARLVLDSLRAAARDGARLYNFIRFETTEAKDRGWVSRLRDVETDEVFDIQSRGVVNATGPWSDRLTQSRTRLRPTKGVHLVVARDRLPVPDAVVLTEGKRILFAIPWGDRTYLGTTDTDFDGPLEAPDCTAEDLDYVLGVVNRGFPELALVASDVRSWWSGLRPLVASRHGNPSDISRRHEITMGEAGWWDVTGGKLTTYRLMAEQTVDRVVDHFKLSAERCRTDSTLLTEGLPVNGLSAVLPPPVTEHAVQHYCVHEWVRHLDDILVRRTSWCHYVEDPAATARTVAGWMKGPMSWNAEKVQEEFLRFAGQLLPAATGTTPEK
jgi:glycerol-3-phosphate dehydrogenase